MIQFERNEKTFNKHFYIMYDNKFIIPFCERIL